MGAKSHQTMSFMNFAVLKIEFWLFRNLKERLPIRPIENYQNWHMLSIMQHGGSTLQFQVIIDSKAELI